MGPRQLWLMSAKGRNRRVHAGDEADLRSPPECRVFGGCQCLVCRIISKCLCLTPSGGSRSPPSAFSVQARRLGDGTKNTL